MSDANKAKTEGDAEDEFRDPQQLVEQVLEAAQREAVEASQAKSRANKAGSVSQTNPSVLTDSGPDKPSRPPYLVIAALTALTVLAANGVWKLLVPAPEVVEWQAEPQELLSEQVLAVKSGESDTIELSKALVIDEELESLRGLENLRILILDAGIITDAGMPAIATLPNLIHLRIRQSLITDAGIRAILGLRNLRVLNLPQANLSLAGIESLKQLERLRQLRLGGDGTTDLSRAVAKLTQLRALHLIDIAVSDEGLRAIAEIPHLESLYLDNARVTEVGWQWLFDNHPEIHVHLNQRHHDRDPNYHIHDAELEVDDMESQGLVDEEAAKLLKQHAAAKAKSEAKIESTEQP